MKVWSNFVCCPAGAGFLLQAEGTWLPNEERAGSFGDHPAESALDGQEPAVDAAPLKKKKKKTSCCLHSAQRCLHY